MNKKKQNEFLSLYKPVHERFERFCRARVYGEMEYADLMNETLMRAYEKFDTLKSKDAFLSFLFSISVRVLANTNRKRNETTKLNHEAFIVSDHSNLADKNADVHLLYLALGKLPEDQKESIILFEITGFSIKEIAAIQKTSESNVKQRLRRGRLKLREVLSDIHSEKREGVTR
ncbi:MAG: RNA polymerase sigma factor [Crocinitomicaceae bacterium]